MVHFNWVNSFSNLRLDIVGIVAVLGEGCTARIIEASALSWHHVLPRFIPAPQALLRHEQSKNLPTEEGIVLGAYSGNFKSRLNFFCRLLHHEPLERNTVELVHVKRKPERERKYPQAFGVRRYGPLAWLSLLGCAMVVVLLGLAVHYSDGFALVATCLLASTSTIVGFASWWNLDLKPPQPRKERADDIPSSDVVIYYPTGAFRVVKCEDEGISRLYFLPEVCQPTVDDNVYRFLALLSSISLMMGLLAMGNSQTPLQIAFAVAYISLNVCYWAISAINPMKYHWDHDFDVKKKKFHDPIPLLPTPNIRRTPSKATAKAKFVSDILSNHHVEEPPEHRPSSTTAHTSNGGAENGVFVRQRSPPTNAVDRSATEHEHLSHHRRKVLTDLEAFRQRVQYPARAFTAPIQRKLTGLIEPILRMAHPPTEPTTPGIKEQRIFTQALWIAIALTGTSRWLINSRIAPDTDVWTKWIKMAGRIARSKKNDAGKIIPACTLDNDGILILPIWNYNGVLNDLLAREDTMKKNAPPDPPTFREIVERALSFKPLIRSKLNAWLMRARMNVQLRELRARDMLGPS